MLRKFTLVGAVIGAGVMLAGAPASADNSQGNYVHSSSGDQYCNVQVIEQNGGLVNIVVPDLLGTGGLLGANQTMGDCINGSVVSNTNNPEGGAGAGSGTGAAADTTPGGDSGGGAVSGDRGGKGDHRYH